MNWGKFVELRGTDPVSLKALNDQLRYLFDRVQGRIGYRQLAGSVCSDIEGHTATLSQQAHEIALRVVKGTLGGANLIRNGGFITGDTTGYGAAGGLSLAYEASQSMARAWSAAGTTGVIAVTLPAFDIKAGLTYCVGLDVLSRNDMPATLDSVTLDGPGGVIQALPAVVTTDFPLSAAVDGARRVWFTLCHDGDEEGAAVTLGFTGTGSAGQGLAVGSVMVEQAAAPGAFCPHASEMKSSALTVTDDRVQIDTALFELILRNASDPETINMILQADGGGFNQLTTDELTVAGYKMGIETTARSIYVDAAAATGGDGSSAHPFKSITAALHILNKQVYKGVAIYVEPGTYNENVIIEDFSGPGSVSIISNSTSGDVVINGYVSINGCTARVTVMGKYSGGVYSRIRINYPSTTDSGRCFYVGKCSQAYIAYVAADGVTNLNTNNFAGFYFQASHVYLSTCDIARVKYGVWAYQNVMLSMVDVKGGTNLISDTGIRSWYNSRVCMNGYPAAAIAGTSTYQSPAVDGTSSALTSTYFGGTAPVLPITKAFTANSARSWRTNETRWISPDCRQGDWGYGNHVGCLWFPTVKGTGGGQIPAGKTLANFTGAKIWWKRDGSSGSSGAQWLYLYTLDGPAEGGAGAADPGTNHGGVCRLAWGQEGWFDIPAQAAFDVYNGKGLCIWAPGGTPYVKLDLGAMPTLQITYT